MMSYLSEDGFSDSCEDVEIQIETLMGNSFDIRVSSTDTIQDIKQRIQRVEGVPVTQQNLIFKSEELKNTKRLSDVGITDGSKLKLVLSMRGGPISTRRLSAPCEHHIMLNDLEELLDITGDEKVQKLTSGSKMSVLLFKEGDMINLIRVVENEDGSYSPYNDKPSTPLSEDEKLDTRSVVFEKVIENNRMMSNLSTLRKKMEDVNAKKQIKVNEQENPFIMENKPNETNVFSCDEDAPAFAYKTTPIVSQRIYIGDEDPLDTEESALKDKHRTKHIASPKIPNRKTSSSLFGSSKDTFSQTKHAYASINKKTKQLRKLNETAHSKNEADSSEGAVKDAANGDVFRQLQLSSRLMDDPPKAAESSKRSPYLWGVQHNPPTRLFGRLPSCKVGLLKRSTDNFEYSAAAEEALDMAPNGFRCSSDDCNMEMCSGSRRGSPVLHSRNPQSIYAGRNYHRKDEGNLCDYYVRSAPKYYQKCGKVPADSKNDKRGDGSWKSCVELPLIDSKNAGYFPKFDERNSSDRGASSCSLKGDGDGKGSIPKDDITERLGVESSIRLYENADWKSNRDPLATYKENTENLVTKFNETMDEIYHDLRNVTNLLCDTKLSGFGSETSTVAKKCPGDLPPIIKKKARCLACNKRLNITNIYNCRCGNVFCSQHRYPEVHHCSYDYKLNGRKLLEQQNPLVTADKIDKI